MLNSEIKNKNGIKNIICLISSYKAISFNINSKIIIIGVNKNIKYWIIVSLFK